MNYFKTVDAYVESFEGKTKEYLLELKTIIKATVPECTELINYNIAAFALVEKGRREEQLMIEYRQKLLVNKQRNS